MELADILREIDLCKQQLDALRPIGPERLQQIEQKFRLDTNYHSNSLEGNSLNYGETKSLLLYGIAAGGKSLRDYLEIKGHDAAGKYLEDLARETEPITEAAIRELHKMILPEPYTTPAMTPDGKGTSKPVVPGQYKTQPNHVRTVSGGVFHFAQPFEVPPKMKDLLDWSRQAEESEHALIQAAGFHYEFARIHPFDDGNGRMARLLMNFLLMRRGFPVIVVPLEKREEYLRAIGRADGEGLDPFVAFLGECLLRSFDLYLRGARGEEIEEPSDLRKKIKLLKTRLDDKIENVGAWEEVVPKAYQGAAIPFLERMREKTKDLLELFEGMNEYNRYGVNTNLHNDFMWNKLLAHTENGEFQLAKKTNIWITELRFERLKSGWKQKRNLSWFFAYSYFNCYYSLDYKVVPDNEKPMNYPSYKLKVLPYGSFPTNAELKEWVSDSCSTIYEAVELMVREETENQLPPELEPEQPYLADYDDIPF